MLKLGASGSGLALGFTYWFYVGDEGIVYLISPFMLQRDSIR